MNLNHQFNYKLKRPPNPIWKVNEILTQILSIMKRLNSEKPQSNTLTTWPVSQQKEDPDSIF